MAQKKKKRSGLSGRDAKTGRWIMVREARRRAATAVVERVRIGRRKKKRR